MAITRRQTRFHYLNLSIQQLYPKDWITCVIYNQGRDNKYGIDSRVIGWTKSRVILETLVTKERFTRVPQNLVTPY